MRKLLKDEWHPQLANAKQQYDRHDAIAQHAQSAAHGASDVAEATPPPPPPSKSREKLDQTCRTLRKLCVECGAMILRTHPVKTLLSVTDPERNSHANAERAQESMPRVRAAAPRWGHACAGDLCACAGSQQHRCRV